MSEMSVRLSVRLYVKRVNCDIAKETAAHILYGMKDDHSSFPIRRMVGEGTTPCT